MLKSRAKPESLMVRAELSGEGVFKGCPSIFIYLMKGLKISFKSATD